MRTPFLGKVIKNTKTTKIGFAVHKYMRATLSSLQPERP